MKRLALLLALCGCAQAQRHPAIAIGIVAGVVGGMACEMDSPAHQSTCGLIAGIAGLGLGGITGIATLIGDTEDHSVSSEDDIEMAGSAVRIHTHTAPPPLPILDAGLPDSAPAVDSGSAVESAHVDSGSNQ